MLHHDQLTSRIIAAAINVHKALGPGFLESVYENALAHDLIEHGFDVKKQWPMPFVCKDLKMEVGYRIDLLVDGKVIVEIKSVEAVAPVHFAQVLTYLKLSNRKLGLLINFNSHVLKDGLHRIVNGL